MEPGAREGAPDQACWCELQGGAGGTFVAAVICGDSQSSRSPCSERAVRPDPRRFQASVLNRHQGAGSKGQQQERLELGSCAAACSLCEHVWTLPVKLGLRLDLRKVDCPLPKARAAYFLARFVATSSVNSGFRRDKAKANSPVTKCLSSVVQIEASCEQVARCRAKGAHSF